MNALSVVIITFNEEKRIERCLKSVQQIADEIIVVDSFSTDSTQSICERYHANFSEHVFDGYVEQKSWALAQAKYDHVLMLDADEALSEELCNNISKIKENFSADGYYSSRTTFIGDKPIKHGSWYPDYKLRLFNRQKGYIGGINPHDRVIMNEKAQVKRLQGTILHYSFDSLEDVYRQSKRFAELSAKAMYQRGKKTNRIMQFIKAGWAFCKSYIVKLGFLDGYDGMVISRVIALSTYSKYKQLRNLQKPDKQA